MHVFSGKWTYLPGSEYIFHGKWSYLMTGIYVFNKKNISLFDRCLILLQDIAMPAGTNPYFSLKMDESTDKHDMHTDQNAIVM
ncbi:MAG: hypothetical protein ACLFM7_00205 [Bacteroidales bacterium]